MLRDSILDPLYSSSTQICASVCIAACLLSPSGVCMGAPPHRSKESQKITVERNFCCRNFQSGLLSQVTGWWPIVFSWLLTNNKLNISNYMLVLLSLLVKPIFETYETSLVKGVLLDHRNLTRPCKWQAGHAVSLIKQSSLLFSAIPWPSRRHL